MLKPRKFNLRQGIRLGLAIAISSVFARAILGGLGFKTDALIFTASYDWHFGALDAVLMLAIMLGVVYDFWIFAFLHKG